MRSGRAGPASAGMTSVAGRICWTTPTTAGLWCGARPATATIRIAEQHRAYTVCLGGYIPWPWAEQMRQSCWSLGFTSGSMGAGRSTTISSTAQSQFKTEAVLHGNLEGLTLYSMMHPHHLSRSTTTRLRQADLDAGTGNLDPLGLATTHSIKLSERQMMMRLGVNVTPKAHPSTRIRPWRAPSTTRVRLMGAQYMSTGCLTQHRNFKSYTASESWLCIVRVWRQIDTGPCECLIEVSPRLARRGPSSVFVSNARSCRGIRRSVVCNR